MSMTDVLGRVQQIQATITQLSPTTARGAAATSSTGTAAASAFASELAKAGSATATTAATAPTATGATGSHLPGAAGLTGDAIVETGKKYLGVPYVFGGEDASGIDCSGLVQRVMKDLGVDVPRLVSGQSTLGTEVKSLKDAKPGDLIVSDGGNHISIYLGDNKILYAPKPGDKVKINSVYFPESDIVTIRRVAPEKTAAAATAALSTAASAGTGTTDLATAALRNLMNGGSL
jgi:cell wall-associated NlpC family hydrolase